jgi:hypothetical protein
MDQFNYRVQFEPFTERHYVKKFQREYRDKWLATERAIIAVCERIDNMLQYNRADLISISGCYKKETHKTRIAMREFENSRH